ncbi:MAG: YicC/YloC family endoribonuclease [bacterium]
MIRSMTGFGKGEVLQGRRSATAQLRSVNSRFLELGLKLPGGLWEFEAEARTLLQASLNRGKVDLVLNEDAGKGADVGPTLDPVRARAWRDALRALSMDWGRSEEPGLDTLLRLPGVLSQGSAAGAEGEEDPAVRWACLKPALEQALVALVESRGREGAAVKRELEGLLRQAEAQVEHIEKLSVALQESFAVRLRKRLGQVLESLPPDDPRLVLEAALAADKADIREETVRFRAHAAEFRRLLDVPEGAVGKRLDFLCQELLREANTMGSKSPASDLTQAVVGLKSMVERLKEQALNVE